jgi:hypothetical protein
VGNLIKVGIFMQQTALVVHRKGGDQYIDGRACNPFSSQLKGKIG